MLSKMTTCWHFWRVFDRKGSGSEVGHRRFYNSLFLPSFALSLLQLSYQNFYRSDFILFYSSVFFFFLVSSSTFLNLIAENIKSPENIMYSAYEWVSQNLCQFGYHPTWKVSQKGALKKSYVILQVVIDKCFCGC